MPVRRRAQFQGGFGGSDAAAAGVHQRTDGIIENGRRPAAVFRRRLAVMQGEGDALVFHQDAGDAVQGGGQPGGGLGHHRHRRRGRRMAVADAGAGDFQAVAAGINQAGDTDPAGYIVQRAPADDANGGDGDGAGARRPYPFPFPSPFPRSQGLQCLQYGGVAGAQGGIIRAGDDIGQGAVKIQQRQQRGTGRRQAGQQMPPGAGTATAIRRGHRHCAAAGAGRV